MLSRMEIAGSPLSLQPCHPGTTSTTLHSCIHQADPTRVESHIFSDRVEAPSFLPLLQQSGGGLVFTPPAGPGGAIVPTPTDNRTVNTSFNETLFGSYKISSIKCKALRDRIVQQTLGALPRSKVNPSDPMCLAWHSKGQCNTNCPCVADHVQYSAAELAPMAAWCVIGYAPPAPAA